MTAQPTKKDNPARKRRRALQARQLVIYTLLAAILAVGALYAAAILTGRTPPPFSRGFTSPTPEVVKLPDPPCPSSPDAKPVPIENVVVNVYNGTTRSNLARIVSDGLVDRGFQRGDVSNSPSSYKYVAEVRTGPASVDAAYTVAAQFVGASIVLDSRTTGDVDVIVGDAFKDLAPTDVADIDFEAPIVAPSNCVPISQTPATDPAAVEGDGQSGEDITPAAPEEGDGG